jgi:hypothetical protein
MDAPGEMECSATPETRHHLTADASPDAWLGGCTWYLWCIVLCTTVAVFLPLLIYLAASWGWFWKEDRDKKAASAPANIDDTSPLKAAHLLPATAGPSADLQYDGPTLTVVLSFKVQPAGGAVAHGTGAAPCGSLSAVPHAEEPAAGTSAVAAAAAVAGGTAARAAAHAATQGAGPTLQYDVLAKRVRDVAQAAVDELARSEDLLLLRQSACTFPGCVNLVVGLQVGLGGTGLLNPCPLHSVEGLAHGEGGRVTCPLSMCLSMRCLVRLQRSLIPCTHRR